MEVVLQLLHENTDTRLAPDAADILTALTTTDSSETFLQPSSELLQQLVFVTKQLLRSCDALNEDAPVADCSQDGIAVSVELSGMKSGHSERSELSSIKEEPSQGLQPPAAPFSQTLGETPARAFAQSASLKLQAGLPPIMTRPDGQHSEAAMPVTPHLPSPEPNAPKDTDPGLTTNRGGAASTSGRPSKDFGWSGSGQTSSSFPASSSSTPHRSLSRSQSIGSTWVGSLLKRISSIRSQNSAEALDLGTGANLRHTVSFQPSQTTSALSPFALFTESKQSPAASHTPTAVQMPQPSTPLSWVPRKPSCSRHPSHPILDATVTALAKCVGSHPAYQGQAQQLGCTPLALDVLSLGRRVGVKGGLVAPAANLIRSLAEGNSQCQHLLGQAGAVGQLLALLQVEPNHPLHGYLVCVCSWFCG